MCNTLTCTLSSIILLPVPVLHQFHYWLYLLQYYYVSYSFAWRLRELPTCFYHAKIHCSRAKTCFYPTKIHCSRAKTSQTQSNTRNDQQCLVRISQFRQTRITPCLSYSQHFGPRRRLFHAVFIANVALELGIKKCERPASDVWCDSCDSTWSPVGACCE
jgi:hypothetical protein